MVLLKRCSNRSNGSLITVKLKRPKPLALRCSTSQTRFPIGTEQADLRYIEFQLYWAIDIQFRKPTVLHDNKRALVKLNMQQRALSQSFNDFNLARCIGIAINDADRFRSDTQFNIASND